MTDKPSNSSSTSALPHCQQRSQTGRRCRLPVADPPSDLCLRHAVHCQKARDAADLATTLTGHL